MPPPNILLIMSDQHSRRVAGAYGDRIVSTPHIDALAARGTLFERAYCNAPLCGPSRMSFMTGRHPCENRLWSNGGRLSSELPTFAHALGQSGYETLLCGRMHFNGPDQRHGFRSRIFPEASGGKAAGMLVGTETFKKVGLELSGPGRNHYLLYDEQCAEAARGWLVRRGGAKNAQPFCMVVGLVGPHCPFVCPEDLFRKYFDRVELPRYPAGHFEHLHPYNRRFRERSGLVGATEHEIRRTRAAYYGMVEFDDRLVGGILETLASAGLARETLVIYTSDHGEMAGEHGMWWKLSFYEGSCAVPLIVSWPGRLPEGRRERALASLLDLAPTLADFAGAPPIPGASGQSLAASLRGERALEERPVFSEFMPPNRDFGPSGGPSRMLRRGDWKCNYYHGEPPELFNLAEDPEELNDRAGDPACRARLDSMLAEIRKGWDPEAIIALERARSRGAAYLVASGSDVRFPPGEQWEGPEGYGFVAPV